MLKEERKKKIKSVQKTHEKNGKGLWVHQTGKEKKGGRF